MTAITLTTTTYFLSALVWRGLPSNNLISTRPHVATFILSHDDFVWDVTTQEPSHACLVTSGRALSHTQVLRWTAYIKVTLNCGDWGAIVDIHRSVHCRFASTLHETVRIQVLLWLGRTHSWVWWTVFRLTDVGCSQTIDVLRLDQSFCVYKQLW